VRRMAGQARRLKGGNYRGHLKVGDLSGSRTIRQARLADMAAFERLPEAIRRALDDLNINLSAETVLAYYQSICKQARDLGGTPYDAEVWTVCRLRAIEQDDLTRNDAPLEISVLRYATHVARRGRHPLRIRP
jgi:hypothetical protein